MVGMKGDWLDQEPHFHLFGSIWFLFFFVMANASYYELLFSVRVMNGNQYDL